MWSDDDSVPPWDQVPNKEELSFEFQETSCEIVASIGEVPGITRQNILHVHTRLQETMFY